MSGWFERPFVFCSTGKRRQYVALALVGELAGRAPPAQNIQVGASTEGRGPEISMYLHGAEDAQSDGLRPEVDLEDMRFERAVVDDKVYMEQDLTSVVGLRVGALVRDSEI
jgi:hypothetical protein